MDGCSAFRIAVMRCLHRRHPFDPSADYTSLIDTMWGALTTTEHSEWDQAASLVNDIRLSVNSDWDSNTTKTWVEENVTLYMQAADIAVSLRF